jgi:phage minor structural protein
MGNIILVDSYGESKFTGNAYILYSTGNNIVAQSFTGKSGYLKSAKFYLKKFSYPTGNAVAKLYAHSGTFGISSVPTGAALATSSNFDVSTLSRTSLQLINFDFDGTYELIDGTKYCISIEYSGGDSSHFIYACIDNTYLEHAGNLSHFAPTYDWFIEQYVDCIFYVYAEEITPYVEPSGQVLSVVEPISLKTEKEVNGAWSAKAKIQPDSNVSCENYLDIDGEEYVLKKLKKIKDSGKYYYDLDTIYHNAIEELTNSTIDKFYITDTVANLLTFILAGSIWTAGTCDIGETVILKTDRRVSRLEALNLLAEKCSGELYYYSKTRIVDLKRQIGTDTKLQLRYDKNSKYIEKEEDSTDLITRIYPYGPDNYPINAIVLDDCEDETLYAHSGGGSTASSDYKQYGSQGIQINSSTLNETFIRDLGAGNVVDLSGYTLLKFKIFSEVANALGFTFGIGESAYTENTVNTGALAAGRWYDIELDLSGVADGSKNAIRYLGFENLTGSAVEVVFDFIRAFNGSEYIDSPNITKYKVNKEFVYNHSAKPEKTIHEVIIYPSDDSYVVQASGGSPNGNYGSEGNLYIRNYAGYSYQSFLKWSFAQIPIGATITGATFGLGVNNVKNGGITTSVYLAAADWNKSTITWNNKPSADGAAIITMDLTALATVEGNLLTTVQNWWSGAKSNYGIFLANATSENKVSRLDSGDSSGVKPYLKITYTTLSNPGPIIYAAALAYMYQRDIPLLTYRVKASDLSKVIEDTWQDEVINIGDTLRLYDKELELNVDVRVKKITKNLLDPSDMDLELANKTYTIVDLTARIAKQLAYAMPYLDNVNIITANAVQEGYLGSSVG